MGDHFPHFIVKYRGLFLDRSRFEQMATGFVKNHATKSVVDNHGHLAGRTGIGMQNSERSFDEQIGHFLWLEILGQLQASSTTRSMKGASLFTAIRCDRRQRQPGIMPLIFHGQTFGIKDLHGLPFLKTADIHLHDLRIFSGMLIHFKEPCDFFFIGCIPIQSTLGGLTVGRTLNLEATRLALASLLVKTADQGQDAHQLFTLGDVGVTINGFISKQRADSDPEIGSRLNIFDFLIFTPS